MTTVIPMASRCAAPAFLPMVVVPADALPNTEFAGAALNADAELHAIAHIRTQYLNKRTAHPTACEALLSAHVNAREHATNLYALACRHGGLPMAWHGTAAFTVSGRA